MPTFWYAVTLVLYVYFLLILARIVIETTRMFARTWRPAGGAAVGVEIVYVTTDPPIRAIRRVLPPLRMGSVSLDLSVIVVLLVILLLRSVAQHLI